MPMNLIGKEEFTEEQKVARHISAMGDSVTVINQAIEKGEHSENAHKRIEANVSHLELMIGKDMIANSGQDLTAFTTAIAAGKSFIAAAN
jgi:hypothetical protein